MCNWQHRSETHDPLAQLIAAESRTCKGCIHRDQVWKQPWCLKHDKPAGKKCVRFKEKE